MPEMWNADDSRINPGVHRALHTAVNMDLNSKEPSTEAQDHRSPEEETRQIQKVALYAFLLNLFLALLKGLLGMVSGSLAVIAGAVDSVSDALSSLAVYGGLKLSTRKTRTFPLGLYKIENLISVGVALCIFFAGYEIAARVFVPASEPPDISLTLVILLLAAAAVTFVFGQYALAQGKKTESPMLIAEGRHRQTDVFSTLVIWISVLLNYFGVRSAFLGITIDQIAAALVLVFVAYTGWELLSNGMRVLLDASLDHATINEVQALIEEHPAVSGVHSLVGRNAGRFRFLQTELGLRTNDLQKAHQISEELENRIRRQIPHVERVIIHYEPMPREFLRVAAPLSDTAGRLSSHFGESPYFAVLQIRLADRHLVNQKIISNPYTETERGKGIRVAEWLVKEKVDELIIQEDIKHKGPGYVLSNAGVRVHVVASDTLEEALDSIWS